MRRSNKGHRDGAVQAAFETAPRVWVLCVKNAFLFAGRVMILGGRFFSPGTSLPRHAQEQSLFVRPRETNRSRKYGFVSGSGMRLTDSGAQDFDRFMSGVHVGLVGFEPTACRRGDRSTVAYRVHLDLAPFCSTARVVLPRTEWQSVRFALGPMVLHGLWLWNRQRCGGGHAQLNFRKSRRSAARFSG